MPSEQDLVNEELRRKARAAAVGGQPQAAKDISGRVTDYPGVRAAKARRKQAFKAGVKARLGAGDVGGAARDFIWGARKVYGR